MGTASTRRELERTLARIDRKLDVLGARLDRLAETQQGGEKARASKPVEPATRERYDR